MDYFTIIANAARAAKIPVILLYSVCAHESRSFTLDYSMYDNGSPSYSVCQIKKSTAILMGWHGKNEMELRNAYVGIKYAALYLKYQLSEDRYNGDWVKAVSAYNAGSYNESSKVKGCPRNLGYLHSVQEKLPQGLKYKLDCGKYKKPRSNYFIDNMEEIMNGIN